MQQMTIDDVKPAQPKRFMSQREVGYQFKINGRPMEVVISNEYMMAVYNIRKEKVYPLRFV